MQVTSRVLYSIVRDVKLISDLDLYCRQPEIDFRTITVGELIDSGSVGEVIMLIR